MATAMELAVKVGVVDACAALDVPRASFYRVRWGQVRELVARPTPARALATQERAQVLSVLNEPRFVNLSPRAAFASLLDEKRYLCSIRTMYRILSEAGEVRERRDQLRHPRHPKPELVARAPNEIWSWDITKLLGPAKWTFYYLYVVLDIFSRYVVGWLLALRECAALARELIRGSCRRQGIVEGKLTVHADRGPSMSSKSLALLLADLGVTRSQSRPHVSNDNPYSEAQFKTMKYRPEFPDRFGSLEHGRSFCREFFPWYNNEHYHSGLGLLTPATVHYGRAKDVLENRAAVLRAAHAAHPERFVRGVPVPQEGPKEVWINRPQPILEVGCVRQ